MRKIRKLSNAELKDNDGEYPKAVFLEPREWMDNAIHGKDSATGGIIYNFDDIVEIYVQKDNLNWVDAVDMVEFHLEKTLPYMKAPQPVVIRDEDGSNFTDDSDWD